MKRAGFVILMVGLCMPVYADPIGDGLILTSLGEQLTELKRHYDMLKDAKQTADNQLSNGVSQLDELKNLTSLNSGSYGFGDLQNSLEDLKQRQGANTWDEALNNLAGGNSERYAQLAAAYERMHPTLSDEEYKQGASDERLALYKQNIAVNKAVTVQTTDAFNQVNKHLAQVHTLSLQIEGNKNKNTKSAVDLNTRLLVEMAYIQTDLFKLQALVSQQAAQAQANEIAADSEAARFNQLPKGK